MTAFADRTVVTIAVRGPLTGGGHPAGGLATGAVTSDQPLTFVPKKGPRAVQGKESGGLAGILGCRIWGEGNLHLLFPQTSPLSLQVPRSTPSQGPVS